MAIAFEHLTEQNLIVIRYSGRVALDDFVTFFHDIEHLVRRHPEVNELGDLTEVTEFALNRREMQALVDLTEAGYRRNDARKRVAFLAPNEPCASIAPVFADYLNQTNTRLQVACFFEADAAYQFVGLDMAP